jgi:hypothetical protein
VVDRQRIIYKRFPQGRSIEKIAEFGEVEVSLNDTVTVDSLHASKAMLNFVLWKKTDGSEMTTTKALNAATVTGAGTNISCLYMAFGYKV